MYNFKCTCINILSNAEILYYSDISHILTIYMIVLRTS